MDIYSNKNLTNYANINYIYYNGSINNFIIDNMSQDFLIKDLTLKQFNEYMIDENYDYMKYLDINKIKKQYDKDYIRGWNPTINISKKNINNYITQDVAMIIMFFSNQSIIGTITNFILKVISLYKSNLIKNPKSSQKININQILNEVKQNINKPSPFDENLYINMYDGSKYFNKNIIEKNNNNELIQHIVVYLFIRYTDLNIVDQKTPSSYQFGGIIKIDYLNNFSKNKTTVNINFMNSFNNIYYIIKNTYSFLKPQMIPITKTNKKKLNNHNIINYNNCKDMMLISFNEANRKYSVSDVLPIIYKVIHEMPLFIIVSTQESKSGGIMNIPGARHFQHILKQSLLNLNYEMLVKNDASKIGKLGLSDKNVRTRIYYNKYYVNYEENKTFGAYKTLKKQGYMSHYLSDNSDRRKIAQNISQEQIFNNNTQKYGKNIVKNNKNKFNIISFGTSLSKISGLGNLSKKTIFKGSIFTRLVFKDNDTNKIYKFAFVNSHLYYNKKGNTGLAQRTTEFLNLIDEFKLVDWWNIGYNIFFSGDLNFRLLSFNTTKNDPFSDTFNKKSNNIVRTYSTNKSLHKQNSFEKLKNNDELYKILLKQAGLSNKIKSTNNTNFGVQGIDVTRIPTNKTINTTIYTTINTNNNLKEIIANQKQAFFKKFLESYEELKINLTSKYFENQGNKNNSFYKKFYNSSEIPTNNEIKEIFEIRPQKNLKGGGLTFSKSQQPKVVKIYPRIPSNTDRILYALSDNLNISADYYDINIFPDKSDHKMLILSFDLENDIPNQNLKDKNINPNNNIISIRSSMSNSNNNSKSNISNTNERPSNISNSNYKSTMSNIKERPSNINNNSKYYNALEQ